MLWEHNPLCKPAPLSGLCFDPSPAVIKATRCLDTRPLYLDSEYALGPGLALVLLELNVTQDDFFDVQEAYMGLRQETKELKNQLASSVAHLTKARIELTQAQTRLATYQRYVFLPSMLACLGNAGHVALYWANMLCARSRTYPTSLVGPDQGWPYRHLYMGAPYTSVPLKCLFERQSQSWVTSQFQKYEAEACELLQVAGFLLPSRSCWHSGVM